MTDILRLTTGQVYLVSGTITSLTVTTLTAGEVDTDIIKLDSTNKDVILQRDAANTLGLRNGTNAQRFNVANTYTSSINREDFSVDWQTLANEALVGTRTAATGTQRRLSLVAQSDNASDTYAAITLRQAGPFVRSGIRTAAGTWARDTTVVGNWNSFGEANSIATTGSIAAFAVIPSYNQPSGNAANTDLLVNRTETLVGSGAQLLLDLQVGSVSKFAVTNIGYISKYSGINTEGPGLVAIRKTGRVIAQTGAVASVATLTTPGTDATYEVSANVLVTAATTANFTVTVAYTDEGNSARTLTLGFTQLSGATFLTAITNVTGTGPYESPVYHIRCKATTTITIATTGTFTSVTYNVEGIIRQLA